MEKKYRVLIVHNEYQFAGGEDIVVKQDAKLLTDHGHEVYLYKRNNEELKYYSKLQKLLLPFTTIYSIKSYKEIRKLIREHQIDVVHVHNTLPLISFSTYYAAKKEKVKLVQTIHNFRLVCPNAMFYREGHICEDCLAKGLGQAVKHNCYRQSKAQTLMVTWMLRIHRMLGTFDKPDAYIALTQFNKNKIATVINPKKIHVKPNYLDFKLPDNLDIDEEPNNYYVYAARLETVKGIFVALRAFEKMPDKRLVVLGTGPEEEQVRQYIEVNHLTNVSLKGFQPHEKTIAYIKQAKALIYPTLWYEGFPMTIVESFACGTPVIASDMPNLKEEVRNFETGFVFESGRPEQLINKIKYLEKTSDVNAIKENCRERFNDYFSEKKVYSEMIRIYENI